MFRGATLLKLPARLYCHLPYTPNSAEAFFSCKESSFLLLLQWPEKTPAYIRTGGKEFKTDLHLTNSLQVKTKVTK